MHLSLNLYCATTYLKVMEVNIMWFSPVIIMAKRDWAMKFSEIDRKRSPTNTEARSKSPVGTRVYASQAQESEHFNPTPVNKNFTSP